MQKRVLAILLSIVILISFTGCLNKNTPDPKAVAQFDELLKEEFMDAVTQDSVTLHYTLKDPSAYGIDEFVPTLGDLDLNKIQEDEKQNAQLLKTLSGIKYSKLNKDQQLTYDILKYSLELSKRGKGLTLYQSILSPTIGLQAQLPILLAEYSFNKEKDITDYIALLNLIDDYFKQVITFEQAKSKEGLFMADFAVDDIINQCNEFTKSPQNNFLLNTFNDKIDEFPDISDNQKEKYKEFNKKAVLDVVIPSYDYLCTELAKLKGTGTNQGGLCNFKNGKKYYEYLVQSTTGSTIPVKDMVDLIDTRLANKQKALQRIYLEDTASFDEFGKENFGTTVPMEILNNLKKQTKTEYPAPPDVNYKIKYVHKSLEDHLSPAFFMVPPVDDSSNNVIYINQNKNNISNPLYPTLAHEGYPGHLYQTTYFAATNPDPIRSVLNFGGYDEGWATYVELQSYNMVDLGPHSASLRELNQINTELSLAMSSRIDIGVNYEGWDKADTSDYLEQLGITDNDTITTIYHSVVEEPANYLKYYIGFLEFDRLRSKAQSKLDSSFSPKEFHETILNVGPAPFSIVEEAVDSYIRSNK